MTGTLKHHSTRSLWGITRGQRLRYTTAVLATAMMSVLLFGAPLIAKFAIDLVVERDFAYAQPQLLAAARWFSGNEPYLSYLVLSALFAMVITAFAGVFLFV